MEISVVGTSFKTAPVEVRERLALTDEPARGFLRSCRDADLFEECLVLSTCNRTEVYAVSRDGAFSLPRLLEQFARATGDRAPLDPSIFYRYDGARAVTHVLRVAAGLDSQVVGEHEILGQMKDAFRCARRAGTVRFLLHKLMHRAFRAGGRVRAETELGTGAASIPGAAVDLAVQVLSKLDGKTVLLVGAGQTAERVVEALRRSGADDLIVANRTRERARELAGRIAAGRADRSPPVRARAVGLAELPAVIAGADVVISSTGSPGYVLTPESLGPAAGRLKRPLLMVDIAVPRDIDPRLAEADGVFLHNIDDLDGLVAETVRRRCGEIPRAEAIVRHEAGQFLKWLDRLQVVPTIKLLRRRLEQLGAEEVERRQGQFCPEDRRELEAFSGALCGKILHAPIAYLHEVSRDGPDSDTLEAIELLRRAFDLDSLEEGA